MHCERHCKDCEMQILAQLLLYMWHSAQIFWGAENISFYHKNWWFGVHGTVAHMAVRTTFGRSEFCLCNCLCMCVCVFVFVIAIWEWYCGTHGSMRTTLGRSVFLFVFVFVSVCVYLYLSLYVCMCICLCHCHLRMIVWHTWEHAHDVGPFLKIVSNVSFKTFLLPAQCQ